MLLHGERIRHAAELAARLVATVLMAVLLWDMVQARAGARGGVEGEGARVQRLTPALARWSTTTAPPRVHVVLDSALTLAQRDWLAALPGARTRVTWEGGEGGEGGSGAKQVWPSAVEVEPVADPRGGARVWAAAPRGERVVLSDALGVLDSVSNNGAGAYFFMRSAPEVVNVSVGAEVAGAAPRDSLRLRSVLVLARAGWESKFVVAALEERGWHVEARLALSPRGDVRQGTSNPIDTSRYSAVIALDTSAWSSAPAIARYVRAGGGLILAAALAGAPPFAALAPGELRKDGEIGELPFAAVGGGVGGGGGERVEEKEGGKRDARRALALVPIHVRADGVPLERRDDLVAVAARREERGRVIVVGYEDTWRWRLGGGDGAVAAYGEWWNSLVSSAAYTAPIARKRMAAGDAAPFAHLVERFGPASSGAAGPARVPHGVPRRWLFGTALVLLLLEWGSRRLRGAA